MKNVTFSSDSSIKNSFLAVSGANLGSEVTTNLNPLRQKSFLDLSQHIILAVTEMMKVLSDVRMLFFKFASLVQDHKIYPNSKTM